MDDIELRTITFKVSHEETEAIDRAAREGGFTRSDYIRQCLLKLQRDSRESPQNVSETRDPMVLFHHIIYGLQRIHTGMYMMVETAGVLSPEQLDAIESATAQRGIEFLSNIDERVAKTRAQLARHLDTAPPAAGK
jgi:Arc/MetJ-type ribon-helix-helix transcriptional regulator